MLLRLLEKLNRKRIIQDRFGRDYMHRYYLCFKEKINAFDTVKPYPNIFIHKLLLSDEDRDVTTIPGTTSPLFLQEVIQNGLRSSTDTVLKSENEAHGEALDQLYGEEPRHFTD